MRDGAAAGFLLELPHGDLGVADGDQPTFEHADAADDAAERARGALAEVAPEQADLGGLGGLQCEGVSPAELGGQRNEHAGGAEVGAVREPEDASAHACHGTTLGGDDASDGAAFEEPRRRHGRNGMPLLVERPALGSRLGQADDAAFSGNEDLSVDFRQHARRNPELCAAPAIDEPGRARLGDIEFDHRVVLEDGKQPTLRRCSERNHRPGRSALRKLRIAHERARLGVEHEHMVGEGLEPDAVADDELSVGTTEGARDAEDLRTGGLFAFLGVEDRSARGGRAATRGYGGKAEPEERCAKQGSHPMNGTVHAGRVPVFAEAVPRREHR